MAPPLRDEIIVDHATQFGTKLLFCLRLLRLKYFVDFHAASEDNLVQK